MSNITNNDELRFALMIAFWNPTGGKRDSEEDIVSGILKLVPVVCRVS